VALTKVITDTNNIYLIFMYIYKIRDQVKEDEMGRECNNCGEEECIYDIGGKAEGKRPLGRPRRMSVDNIKMDLREIGWDGMAWIDLAQDRDRWRALVNTVMNLRVA
jgi:hypothetical protein